MGRPILTWDDLSKSILSKFDRLDYGQIVGSFNKLRQTTGVESYIDSFEELRASLLEFNPCMAEYYLLHSFINGLQEEIRHGVDMFRAKSLELAYDLAEREERKVEALWRKSFYFKGSNNNQRPQQGKSFPNPKTNIGKPTKEFKKGKCFKYDDKWAPGHQCKAKTFHQMEGELSDEEDEAIDEEEIIAEASPEEGETEGEVTLNAISCTSPPSTLKLSALVKGIEVQD